MDSETRVGWNSEECRPTSVHAGVPGFQEAPGETRRPREARSSGGKKRSFAVGPREAGALSTSGRRFSRFTRRRRIKGVPAGRLEKQDAMQDARCHNCYFFTL